MNEREGRRRFLQWLAAAPALPLLSLASSRAGFAAGPSAVAPGQDQWLGDLPSQVLQSIEQYESRIASAKDAITVFDLETAARRKLHVGHLAYLAGVEDQATLRANRAIFARIQLRPRRLTGVGKSDASTTLFGATWNTPLLLCPCGRQGAFDLDAEVAVARAAKSRQHLQVLSNAATRSIEDVTSARGQPVWSQLYQNLDWNKTRAMIRRAENSGAPVLVFTIDSRPGTRREILAKVRRQNADFCRSCHVANGTEDLTNLGRGLFGDAVDPMNSTPPLGPPQMDGPATWDYVKRLKDTTRMKLVVKGIVTREDAALALEHGVDGIWVSNHGGLQDNSGRSTMESLSEVIAGVGRRVPVIVDGGFRRGTDIFKALAVGATAVGIGRPYLWGLGAFGQSGVEAALDILDFELRTVMLQMGIARREQIDRSYIQDDLASIGQ